MATPCTMWCAALAPQKRRGALEHAPVAPRRPQPTCIPNPHPYKGFVTYFLPAAPRARLPDNGSRSQLCASESLPDALSHAPP